MYAFGNDFSKDINHSSIMVEPHYTHRTGRSPRPPFITSKSAASSGSLVLANGHCNTHQATRSPSSNTQLRREGSSFPGYDGDGNERLNSLKEKCANLRRKCNFSEYEYKQSKKQFEEELRNLREYVREFSNAEILLESVIRDLLIEPKISVLTRKSISQLLLKLKVARKKYEYYTDDSLHPPMLRSVTYKHTVIRSPVSRVPADYDKSSGNGDSDTLESFTSFINGEDDETIRWISSLEDEGFKKFMSNHTNLWQPLLSCRSRLLSVVDVLQSGRSSINLMFLGRKDWQAGDLIIFVLCWVSYSGSVRTLRFKNAILDKELAFLVSDNLPAKGLLQRFEFEGCTFLEQSVLHIMRSLLYNQIPIIYFADCRINASLAEDIYEACSLNLLEFPPGKALVMNQLRELQLPGNNLGDEGILHLSNLINSEGMESLRRLDLRCNRISDIGAVAFARAVVSLGRRLLRVPRVCNEKLNVRAFESLSIAGNNLGAEGVLALLDASAHFPFGCLDFGNSFSIEAHGKHHAVVKAISHWLKNLCDRFQSIPEVPLLNPPHVYLRDLDLVDASSLNRVFKQLTVMNSLKNMDFFVYEGQKVFVEEFGNPHLFSSVVKTRRSVMPFVVDLTGLNTESLVDLSEFSSLSDVLML